MYVPISRLSIIVALVLSASDSIEAHPVSHTDAWVRIDDTTSVRLILFLDDVVRHQNVQPDSAGHIDKATFSQAMDQHGQLLLEQLKLFDQHGKPLSGQLISPPRWSPPEQGINLDVDASLKLTWQFDFGSSSGLTALTFLHQFTHESLVQPGELRLHVLDGRSNDRTDAVVRPLKPHTVRISSTNDGKSAGNATFEPTTRLIVTRFGVVVEFESPLPAVENVMPAISGYVVDSLDRQFVLSQQQTDALNASLRKWFSENLIVRCDGYVLSARSMETEILPLDNFSDSSSTPGDVPNKSQPTAGTVMGSRVAVRMAYSTDRSPQSVEVAFLSATGDYDHLTAQTVSSFRSSTSRVALANRSESNPDEPPTNLLNRVPVATISWAPMANPGNGSVQTQPIGNSIGLVADTRYGTSWMIATLLTILLAIFFSRRYGDRTGTSDHFKILAFLFCALLLAVALAVFIQPAVAIDQSECQQIVEHLLSDTYNACMLLDERASIEQLSATLHADMVEEVFLAAAEQMASDPEGNPLLDIDTVTVDRVSAEVATRRPLTIGIVCNWTVRGVFTHWGHAHNRDMNLTGHIVLSQDDPNGDWKIQELSLTEPVRFAALTEGTEGS